MSQVNKIDELLRRVRDAGAEDDNMGAMDWTLSDKVMDEAKQALLSAILGVIPENELNVASDFKNAVLIEGKNIGREQCRQAIKGLFSGVQG